jgi:putative transposase
MPRDIVAIDFFLVPTLTFRLLFIFVVLRHGRRELLHLGVTDRPTATWTAQQLVEVFPNDTAPTYLLRDRDGVYGDEFVRRIKGMAIHQVLTAPCAPWQNPFVERVIGFDPPPWCQRRRSTRRCSGAPGGMLWASSKM